MNKYRTEEERQAAIKASKKKYADKPEVKARQVAYYKKARNNPAFLENEKNVRLLKNYGITFQQFYELIGSQNGLCALCKIKLGPEIQNAATAPVVDHCHKTGKVRGILHRKCNSALGIIGDSLDAAKNLIAYLEQNNATPQD